MPGIYYPYTSFDEAVAACCAAVRECPSSIPYWVRLRGLVATASPADALAVAQRAFDLGAGQLWGQAVNPPADGVHVDLVHRLRLIQTLRLQLTEELLLNAYWSVAAYHLRRLQTDANTLPLPTDLTAYPHVARWVREPWHAIPYRDTVFDQTLASRLSARAARLVAIEPLAEWPAVLVYHHEGQARLLLPPEAAVGRNRLLFAANQLFPSLLSQPPGTPVQVRIGLATRGALPEAFGVALRPAAPAWDGLPDEPAVVWRVELDPGVKAATQEPLLPYAVLVLTGGRRVKTLLDHFGPAGMWPRPGDAFRVRCLPPDVSWSQGVVSVAPDPTPDPALWRPFRGPLRLSADSKEFGLVENDIGVFVDQVPPDAWRDGQLLTGVATVYHDTAHRCLIWRAVRVQVA